MRRLIVNADDFGLSPGVNRGIIRAHREGIVTSSTLMVNLPGAAEAARMAAGCPELGVGIHLNLTYGPPVLPPERVPSLVDDQGRFRRPWGGPGEALSGKLSRWSQAVELDQLEMELRAQIHRAGELGLSPSHLDGHHHVETTLPVLEVVARLALEHRLPVRSLFPRTRQYLRSAGVPTPEFCWGRYIQPPERRRRSNPYVRTLPFLPWQLSEFFCHPGECDDELRAASGYIWQREVELKWLTSERLRELFALENIQLVSYRALR